MENSNALLPGTLLLNYRVESVLGAGGFGITYKAHDLRLDTTVAIKEYFPAALAVRTQEQTVVSRPEFGEAGYSWGRDKFVHEATSLARLRHPNIVGVDYLFHHNGTAYMTLDFVDGPSLSQWLKQPERQATQEDLEAILFPLLDALEVVHAKGLLHRDIAPKNIMIAPGMNPVLIDFGAARQIVAQHSRTFAAILTPGYAPFEQYTPTGKDQGPWTDIYAMAATLYQAIAGSPPADAPDRLIEDPKPSAVDAGAGRFSNQFLEAVDWGLRPLPKDRPQSVTEWREAFGTPLSQAAGADEAAVAAGGNRSALSRWLWR